MYKNNLLNFFIVLMTILFSSPNKAWTKSTTNKTLKPIVVTAKRMPASESKTVETVITYTQSDILKTGARDLGEALSYTPGVDVQFNGQFGQATALSINGSSSRQVLLMIDGIPFNTQLSGQANPAQISIEAIERIEIIKGSASSAWGSSLGGVVNVITKSTGKTTQPTGRISQTIAEFDTTKSHFEIAGTIKRIGYFAAASYFDTDGPQVISNAQSKSFFQKLSLDLDNDQTLTGSFGYNTADAQYALATSGTIRSQPYSTQYGQLQWNANFDEQQWNMALKFNQHDITTDIINVSNGSTLSSTISKNLYRGVSINGHMNLSDNITKVIGTDFDWSRLKSNQFLDSSKDINMRAVYTNYTFKWNQWDLVGGLRFDHNDQFGSQTSPSLGAIYYFDDQSDTLIRTKASRAFNAPPLLWVFNDDPTQLVGPNPDLKAERSTNYEIGFETKLFSRLDVQLSAFLSDINDAIAPVFDINQSLFIQTNFQKFRRQGIDLIFNYVINETLSIYSNLGFTDVENKVTGQTVRDAGVARQRFKFGLKYKTKKNLSFHLSGYYYRWSSPASLNANDRKPIFDLKVNKKFRAVQSNIDFDIFINVQNIGNSKYWAIDPFPLPRRYVETGIAFNF